MSNYLCARSSVVELLPCTAAKDWVHSLFSLWLWPIAIVTLARLGQEYQ
jgi:hypothetical protein